MTTFVLTVKVSSLELSGINRQENAFLFVSSNIQLLLDMGLLTFSMPSISDIMRRRLVGVYRRCGTACYLKMGQIDCMETSVISHQLAPPNIPKERRLKYAANPD